MLRWKQARARSSGVMALTANACALAAGSPSRAARTSAEDIGAGSPHVPRPGRRRRLLGRPVAAPLALRQQAVGVGLLLQHEPAVLPALCTATHPVQDPKLPQPGQRGGDRAHADAGLGRDRRVGRVQAPGAVVQEVEDQRVQDLQRGVADGATVVTRLVGAAVEVTGPVPKLDRGLLGQWHEPDGVGDGAAPDRPGGV